MKHDPDKPPTRAQVRAALSKRGNRSVLDVAQEVGVSQRVIQYNTTTKGASHRMRLPAWRMLLLVLGIHPRFELVERDRD